MITIVSTEPLIVRVEGGERLKISEGTQNDFLLEAVYAGKGKTNGRVLFECGEAPRVEAGEPPQPPYPLREPGRIT
jgi:hypothetical protein